MIRFEDLIEKVRATSPPEVSVRPLSERAASAAPKTAHSDRQANAPRRRDGNDGILESLRPVPRFVTFTGTDFPSNRRETPILEPEPL